MIAADVNLQILRLRVGQSMRGGEFGADGLLGLFSLRGELLKFSLVFGRNKRRQHILGHGERRLAVVQHGL